MSVCPPADRSARVYGRVRGLRWRTPGRRWSMSSKRSDNCGRNSSHRDYGRGRSVLRSSLCRHICLLRHGPKQRCDRTCVRESYRKDCGGYRRSIEPRRANTEASLNGLGSPSTFAGLRSGDVGNTTNLLGCKGCGRPTSEGWICWDCTLARAKAANLKRCVCGSLEFELPVSHRSGSRVWFTCRRCLGVTRQVA